MNEIISLIWLTHPTALNDAITAAREESPEDAEYEFSYLFGAILNDDTFNGYSPRRNSGGYCRGDKRVLTPKQIKNMILIALLCVVCWLGPALRDGSNVN